MQLDPLLALHSAARQYCIDRAMIYHQRYAQLVASGEAMANRFGGDYTAEAYNIFPRYQVLAAIQSEIESFLPTGFKSLEDLRGLLELAGASARSDFTNYNDPVGIAAVEDERQRFVLFIRTLDEAHLAGQQMLPFRRTLGSAEHEQVHAGLAQRWGNWYGGSLDRMDSAPDVVTLHVEAMTEPESYDRLRAVLTARGIPRLFELREYGDGFEMDMEIATFTYNGAEGFWTSGDFGWLVYASHESSITFGSSWLVEQMRKAIPEFERYVYKGWDLAAYA